MGKCDPDCFVADCESALKVEAALDSNPRPGLKGGKLLVLQKDHEVTEEERALIDSKGWVPYQEMVRNSKDKGKCLNIVCVYPTR